MAVDPIIDVDKFTQDVGIPATDLSGSFRKQGALFAHYASLHYKALKQEFNYELKLKVLMSQLDKEIRDRAATEGEKKPSEKQIEQEIARTASYVSALLAYNDAAALVDLTKNALEAFKQRKDMLVQLGANERQELSADISMTHVNRSASTYGAATRKAVMDSMSETMNKGV